MSWHNDDTLTVKFGVEEAEKRNIGAYNVYGPVHELEILLKFGELPTVAGGVTILNDNFAIPAGAKIEEVEVTTPTTTWDSTSDGALWNVGTIDQDRTSNGATAGLVSAATQTEMNAGGTNVAGWVGSLVGTVLTTSKLLTWEIDTQDVTAGQATVRVRWSIPPKNEDTLAWSKS